MNNVVLLFIAAVVVLFLITGIILALLIKSRKHTEHLRDQFGPEYNRAVSAAGDEKKARTELDERRRHVEALNIHPLSTDERSRYLAEWTVVQTKFVDEPGQAVAEADRLIMEVMQLRAYPVTDFDQRAADISVNYPDLVSHYRAAREIALKNKQQQANTEELRQAMIYYRSLFEELLGTEAVVAMEH